MFSLILILTFLLGLNICGVKLNVDSTRITDFSDVPAQSVRSVQTYSPRSPIWITNDNNLNNSFPGRGTIDDPIRIEGYNITASSGDLIYISGTTYYFRIANCLLNGLSTASQGIEFSNVANGTIEHNIIKNNANQGILFMSGSDNNSLVNNTIHDNGGVGLLFILQAITQLPTILFMTIVETEFSLKPPPLIIT